MKTILRLLRLEFIPFSADAALLVLRLWLGVSMVSLHGWGKLSRYSDTLSKFGDPLGIGREPSLRLAIFAEVVCAVLVAIGLLTRFAAVSLCITMGVAFFAVHRAQLSGPMSGELAFVYLGGFVALVLAGPGRFSADARM